MNVQGRITVTAAEFTRQFGQLRHALGDSPVHVTHHGRETHVLLAAARYDELRRQSLGDAAGSGWPELSAFAEWIEQGVLVLAPDATVSFANATAHAMFECAPDVLAGRSLWDAAPGLAGSLAAGVIQHALATGEPGCADLPSPFRSGRWLQVAVHPSGRTTTILLSDITDDVQRDRIADAPGALAAAVAMHPGIGMARLNQRGLIESASDAFCRLIGLNEQRLRGIALADLMPIARKAAFRERLEQVLGPEADTTTPDTAFESELLTNAGQATGVELALAGLHGAYGGAGAVVVITRA